MTIVMTLQLLVATLAGLLLVEARMHRDEQRRRDSFGDTPSIDIDIDFDPGLIVAWDDEANYARRRPCTRSAKAELPDARRPLLVDSRPSQRLR